MRFKSSGKAEYTVEDFAASMDATEKQRADFAALRRKMIEPAVKELTEKDGGEYMLLDLPTWSGTAEMAALSRALGGYHIPVDNDVGLQVGRAIAEWSFPRYTDYFKGTATVRP